MAEAIKGFTLSDLVKLQEAVDRVQESVASKDHAIAVQKAALKMAMATINMLESQLRDLLEAEGYREQPDGTFVRRTRRWLR